MLEYVSKMSKKYFTSIIPIISPRPNSSTTCCFSTERRRPLRTTNTESAISPLLQKKNLSFNPIADIFKL